MHNPLYQTETIPFLLKQKENNSMNIFFLNVDVIFSCGEERDWNEREDESGEVPVYSGLEGHLGKVLILNDECRFKWGLQPGLPI